MLQTRQRVLQLSQLDGQSRFVRAGMIGEDVQDQLGAVQHLHANRLFQVAGLSRRKIVIQQNDVGLQLRHRGSQLVNLATSQIGAPGGLFTPLNQLTRDTDTRRFGQPP